MPALGWKQLLEGAPWFRGEGKHPIAAYSEYIPPPRLAVKPYSKTVTTAFDKKDLWGWQVTEFEEAFEFRPGMEHLAQQIVKAFAHLGRGEPAHGIAHRKLMDNTYWPAE